MSVSEDFTKSGKSLDEIVLTFSDRKKLFVSESFLRYASPVFEKMFKLKFKESETRQIDMEDKIYEDFLELLLCLHPRKQKPIDEQNVLRLVCLAHEYQLDPILQKCDDIMKKILLFHEEKNDDKDLSVRCGAVIICSNILLKAAETKLQDLFVIALQTIAKFDYRAITGKPIFGQGKLNPLRSFSGEVRGNSSATDVTHEENALSRVVDTTQLNDPVTECKALFDSFPDELKLKLLLERLSVCDEK